MRALGVFFYTTILVIIGLLMMVFSVAFSFEKLQPLCEKYISNTLLIIQGNANYRIIIFLSGLLLILISFSLAQLILSRFQREKTIAFSTPSGKITVALTAVEDLIRRLSNLISEVKELRPTVIANRKGIIIVDLRVILKSEANMPELTSRLQEMTKSEIQRVLGLEQEPVINIHIAKIASIEEKDKKRKEFDKQEPTIPFSGYGRV
ncbi:MAG: alkaline shock response membrane anchor protein AmaP [Candidatus Omnitrophica bacterium]|nr:alkaline shock response membrane anchor protein AmaP [Candidatus Omnitrophota bacterium]